MISLPVAAEDFEDRVAPKVKNASQKNYLSFSFENDSIGGGSDRFYTSGAQFSWFNAGTPVPDYMDRLADYIPTFDINETTSTVYTLGQNIFTPEDISVRAPQPDDRPYAGWLYGSVGLASVTNDHIDELELTVGVVGPEALGEQTQKFVHKHITDSQIPKGWSNQLDSEPGLILSWRRRWPQAVYMDFDDIRFSAAPDINASLGNIYTYAGAGLTFTFGPYQDTLQDTPPRVRPGTAGTGYFETPDQGWSWYLFASADARAVGRNIFLDGNTFSDSLSVSKKPFVGDLSAGLAFTIGDYRLAYSYNVRTKEFDGQESESEFGSLTFTARF